MTLLVIDPAGVVARVQARAALQSGESDLRFFVVTFFVGLVVFGWLVAWAIWAFAAGHRSRLASRRDVDVDIVHAHIGGWVAAGVVVTLIAAGVVGTYIADEAEDAYVCGRDNPTSGRRVIDPVEYQQANLALVRAIPQFASDPLTTATSRADHRCPLETTGDVVGIITTFTIAPLPSGKCAYMESLEAELRSAGWQVHASETPMPDGRGRARATHAERGNAWLEANIDGLGTQLFVSVDHDSGPGAPLQTGFASMACT